MNTSNSSDVAQPVRILHETSPHRTVGGLLFQGLMPYPAEYESYNEKHVILLLSLCHDVKEIRSQPIKFPYIKQNSKDGHHTPDFEVFTSDGFSIFIEVKAIENLLKAKNIEEYTYIARQYLHQNKRFSFLTNVQIEQKPLFDSILLLYRYLNSTPTDISKTTTQHHLANGPMSINLLLKNSRLELLDIYILIARRYLCFDLNLPLNRESMVR